MDEICSVLRRKESQIKFRMVYLGLKERSILGKSIYPQNGYAHQGLPWYPEEEEKLRKLYLEGKTPQQMSAGIQRSISSIMIRLERMGLIKDQHEYVPPESIRF